MQTTMTDPALEAKVPIRELGTIALVSSQLAMILLVIHQFQLESRTFFYVMSLGAAGFVIHALLPLKYRLSFFAFLSIAAIIVAFGPLDGIFLIFLGLVLIGICHLPVRMAFRIVLLLITGTLFAVWRMELLPAPWSVAIWPILASMFMFRLAIYLYSHAHGEQRSGVAQTLAYFFMLPNVCFPLYPVIDYSTFTRSHYDNHAARIYNRGIRWIVRGLVHLILYRFVYLHLLDSPNSVQTLGGLIQFMLATFLLYLRVSGQFHLITGVLHLFGFHLPVTNHLYYLASSFPDIWRRINIYWKDFMMKLVYYPSYFWLRRWGPNFALIVSTVIVFIATWFLHSYQWFWLRGGFPLELQDALFWTVIGSLVMIGTLRDMKRPRKRTLSRGPAWSASLALCTVGTFTAHCVIWSMWTAESVTGWLAMLTAAGNVDPMGLWLLCGLVGGGLLVAGRAWSLKEADDDNAVPFYRLQAVHSTAVLLIILAMGNTAFYAQPAPRLAATVASLEQSTLNASDAALQHKGYYEKLDNDSRMSAELWNIQAQKPAHWLALTSTEAYRLRDDFLLGDLSPNVRIIFEDQPLTTNRWGMRDRDRVLSKPQGTYRIALLGPSSAMGSGVADGETFADFLEQRLNRSVDSRDNERYEVMNFGVAGYSLLQQLEMLDRAVKFQPDAVFITDSQGAKGTVLSHFESVILSGAAIPYPELAALAHEVGITALGNPGIPVPFENVRALLATIGVTTRMPGREANRRLQPAGDMLVRWTLERLAAVTREHGATPVFVALNVVSGPSPNMTVLQQAEAAGFIVFDLLKLWDNRDTSGLRVAEWDDHANAAGNQLIADNLFELIQQHKSQLRLLN